MKSPYFHANRAISIAVFNICDRLRTMDSISPTSPAPLPDAPAPVLAVTPLMATTAPDAVLVGNLSVKAGDPPKAEIPRWQENRNVEQVLDKAFGAKSDRDGEVGRLGKQYENQRFKIATADPGSQIDPTVSTQTNAGRKAAVLEKDQIKADNTENAAKSRQVEDQVAHYTSGRKIIEINSQYPNLDLKRSGVASAKYSELMKQAQQENTRAQPQQSPAPAGLPPASVASVSQTPRFDINSSAPNPRPSASMGKVDKLAEQLQAAPMVAPVAAPADTAPAAQVAAPAKAPTAADILAGSEATARVATPAQARTPQPVSAAGTSGRGVATVPAAASLQAGTPTPLGQQAQAPVTAAALPQAPVADLVAKPLAAAQAAPAQISASKLFGQQPSIPPVAKIETPSTSAAGFAFSDVIPGSSTLGPAERNAPVVPAYQNSGLSAPRASAVPKENEIKPNSPAARMLQLGGESPFGMLPKASTSQKVIDAVVVPEKATEDATSSIGNKGVTTQGSALLSMRPTDGNDGLINVGRSLQLAQEKQEASMVPVSPASQPAHRSKARATEISQFGQGETRAASPSSRQVPHGASLGTASR